MTARFALSGSTRLLVTLGCLTLLSLADAQFSTTRFNFLGKSAPAIRLYGAEFARDDVLSGPLRVTRSGEVVRVEGFGRVLLLPIDRDGARAATNFNTVQLDTARLQARTATLVNGNLYLPLDTLARGLGVQYAPGSFTLPAPQLTGVSSRAGKDADRLVLDLNRDVRFVARATAKEVEVVLPGTTGAERTYTTRGRYLPQVRVARRGGDLVLSAPLPAGAGYRVYRAGADGNVRLILDVGPGIEASVAALAARARKPLIVLDPVAARGEGALGDVALEVAREAAELLTAAGWQVRLTRTASGAASLAERAALARESDVFLSLDLARFPGAAGRGVTLYEGGGSSAVALINNVRGAGVRDALAALAVSGAGDNRRLAQLLQGEFKALNVPARSAPLERAYLLREAPKVALLLELGSAQSEADAARLSDEGRRRGLATALARSVATYLAARAGGSS